MTPNEYQELASRTLTLSLNPNKFNGTELSILWNSLALNGEAGEIAELVKKGILHRQGLDPDKLKKELGDCLWYIASLCTIMEFNLEEVMAMNIEKLIVRYPNGFNYEDSKRRVDVQ